MSNDKKLEELESKLNLIEQKLDAFLEAFCSLHENPFSRSGEPKIAKMLSNKLTSIEQREYERQMGEEY